MRDYANPTLLLIVVGLFAWGLTYGDQGTAAGAWAMGLCITAFLVNGALCLARALTRRPSLMSVVWSVVYLILAGCAWVLVSSPQEDVYAEERESLNRQLNSWKEQGQSPFATAQQEQQCLLILAAGLGKNHLLRELLALPDAGNHPEVLQAAAAAAAGNGRKKALQQLLEAGVDVNTRVAGTSLLCTAVVNGCPDNAELLLTLGASPHPADAEGVSPIMHAVINEDLSMARLLMKHGADPTQKNADGRDAFSYSRTEEMDAVLQNK